MFINTTWGPRSGMGPPLNGEDICATLLAEGSSAERPYADTGAWMGRVASARRLFGIMSGIAVGERGRHCQEVQKLAQIWFPGLSIVDEAVELFWTPELEIGARDGFNLRWHHALVKIILYSTERELCWTHYWNKEGKPGRLKGTGHTPFVLHFPGSAKGLFLRQCHRTYSRLHVKEGERWSLIDMDRGGAARWVKLPQSMAAVRDLVGDQSMFYIDR
eukprot:TRINITY_DN32910_c0_g1_i1.p1 TRINITY_DN32910_c0_g1~~TRINITY_DN32910_c0_g1_i1.p1  ORF type:complete len:218 (+),score=36.19 TRINITY_DN32910_c0_g1_i1:303-956(+)